VFKTFLYAGIDYLVEIRNVKIPSVLRYAPRSLLFILFLHARNLHRSYLNRLVEMKCISLFACDGFANDEPWHLPVK
jgi:hypothetical protein